MSPVRLTAARQRAAGALCAFALSLLLTASGAQAGVMRHWACRSKLAPTGNSLGWTTYATAPGSSVALNCAGAGGLQGVFIDMRNVSQMPAGAVAGAYYAAPANTSIATAYVSMNGVVREADQSASMGMVMYRDIDAYDDTHILEQCQFFAGCNTITSEERAYDVHGARWYATVACGSGNPQNVCFGGDRGYLQVNYAAFDLRDESWPTAPGTATGTATQAGALSGTETLLFPVSDVGVGVADVDVTIGGVVVVPRRVISDNGGSCVPVEGGYRFPVPCPLSGPVSLSLDTKKVPNGTHMLTARIWDAAGNESTVVSLRVTINNTTPAATPTPTPTPKPTPTDPATPFPAAPGGSEPTAPGGPNGSGGVLASATFRPARKIRKVSATLGRVLKLTGRLADGSGKAIVQAKIDVYETVSGGGARALAATIETDAKGAYEYRPATTAGRLVELGYAAAIGSTSYVATTRFEVEVHGRISFSVNRRTAFRGQTVVFRGKALGPVPDGGAVVELSALAGGRRIVFKNVRTRADGTFSYARRFRTTGRFTFQARTVVTGASSIGASESDLVRLRIR